MLPCTMETASLSQQEWWHGAFDATECAAIEEAFQPVGGGSAESMAASENPLVLGTLAGHLKKEHLRHLGYRILARADTLVSPHVPILSLHFYFMSRGDFHYRWRELDPTAIEEAIESYRRQIGLASQAIPAFRNDSAFARHLPAHAGYRQLRIIEEKRGNFLLARELCEQAKKVGWSDDWDKRIQRINKKLARITPSS